MGGKNTVESTLTSKGQVTIPKEAREHLHLRPGDRVKFFIQPDGHVVILPRLPASALRGMVPKRKGPPVSLDEMDKAIAAGAVARYVRGTRR
jgi:AbrB family looped-hinge helix DNA binding protein